MTTIKDQRYGSCHGKWRETTSASSVLSLGDQYVLATTLMITEPPCKSASKMEFRVAELAFSRPQVLADVNRFA